MNNVIGTEILERSFTNAQTAEFIADAVNSKLKQYIPIESIMHEIMVNMYMQIPYQRIWAILQKSFNITEKDIEKLVQDDQSRKISDWDGDTFYSYNPINMNEYVQYRHNYMHPEINIRAKVIQEISTRIEEEKPHVYNVWKTALVETWDIEKGEIVQEEREFFVNEIIDWQN